MFSEPLSVSPLQTELCQTSSGHHHARQEIQHLLCLGGLCWCALDVEFSELLRPSPLLPELCQICFADHHARQGIQHPLCFGRLCRQQCSNWQRGSLQKAIPVTSASHLLWQYLIQLVLRTRRCVAATCRQVLESSIAIETKIDSNIKVASQLTLEIQ